MGKIILKEAYRPMAQEIEASVGKRLKAIILATPIFFKEVAVLCKERFGLAAEAALIEEYLASSYWASREFFGDQMVYQDERAAAAAKQMDQAEVEKLSVVVYLADKIEEEIAVEEKKRKDFLARKKVGMILRVYATEERFIPDRLTMVEKAIAAARQATVDGQPLIRRIDVMVWNDQRYEGADCGQTARALRSKFSNEKDLFITDFKHGDLFCAILNRGIFHQSKHGVDYSLIVSAEAFSYMTPETMKEMVTAVCRGALAVGVAITELTDSILEGRLANTFCLWNNEALMTVGGFDMMAAKPDKSIFPVKVYVGKKQTEAGLAVYHGAGVEEVVPLIRLYKNFDEKPCLAPILPQGAGIQRYIVPDKEKDPEGWRRHWNKIGTKLERQMAHLNSIGVFPSALKEAVMQEYRCWE